MKVLWSNSVTYNKVDRSTQSWFAPSGPNMFMEYFMVGVNVSWWVQLPHISSFSWCFTFKITFSMSWKLMSHKSLHTDIYSSFIQNCRSWKYPWCPLEKKWINKGWHIQIMNYYSALKINEQLKHEKTLRIFNGCYFEKEISVQRLHIAWFQLDDI